MSILELTSEIKYLEELKENAAESEQKLLSEAITQLERVNWSVFQFNWKVEDVFSVFNSYGFVPSKENVEILLENGLKDDLNPIDNGIYEIAWDITQRLIPDSDLLPTEDKLIFDELEVSSEEIIKK